MGMFQNIKADMFYLSFYLMSVIEYLLTVFKSKTDENFKQNFSLLVRENHYSNQSDNKLSNYVRATFSLEIGDGDNGVKTRRLFSKSSD